MIVSGAVNEELEDAMMDRSLMVEKPRDPIRVTVGERDVEAHAIGVDAMAVVIIRERSRRVSDAESKCER
jgi:hypothetical protein